MKKLSKSPLIALFFLFSFCPLAKAVSFIAPPDTASDVITLMNGKLIYCKVKSVGLRKVKYIPHGCKKDSVKEIKSSLVYKVNYPEGYLWIVTRPRDTLHRAQSEVQISINFGLSSPSSSYGSSAYDVTEDQTGVGTICGFASQGFTANVMLNIVIWKGFKFTFTGGYLHGGFDAQGYLNELAATPDAPVNFINPTATGKYYYNNYSFFAGISQNIINQKQVFFNLRFLVGLFNQNFPVVQGRGYGNPLYTSGGPIAINVPACNSMAEGIDLGASIGVRVLPYMNVILNADYIYAGGGESKFQYNVLGLNPYDPDIFIANFTLGVQFEL